MKTRQELYRNEALPLINTITTYRTLKKNQLLKMFPPQKTDAIKMLIRRYVNQGMIFRSEDGIYISGDSCIPIDEPIINAFWVLLDFLDKAEYHSSGMYPAQICFFADKQFYEIIDVPLEKEQMISVALSGQRESSRRILVLADVNQMAMLNVSDVAGYCTVSRDGDVSYYQKEENADG